MGLCLGSHSSLLIVPLSACFSYNYRKVAEEEGAPDVLVYDFTPLPLPLKSSTLQKYPSSHVMWYTRMSFTTHFIKTFKEAKEHLNTHVVDVFYNSVLFLIIVQRLVACCLV